MRLHVQPSHELHGRLRIPGSKSQSVRALLVACLAKGVSEIHFLPASEDVNIALGVCRDLGATLTKIDCHNGCVRLESTGVPLHPIKDVLWTGNSGITTRFVLPILGLVEGGKTMRIEAGAQMQKRPLSPLLQNLSELGCTVESSTWPVAIRGPLNGGRTQVNGLTSQFVSALLLSGCYAKSDLELIVEDLNERPYMELTLEWLEKAGIRFEHTREGRLDHFRVFAGQSFSPIDTTVPGDYSSASTFLAMGAVCEGQIEIEGLDLFDTQGDRRLLTLLTDMGASLEWEEGVVRVKKSKLRGIEIDANDVPDLVPTLAVLGTQAEGETRILNVPQARVKETDRLHSMTEGLRKMGADIEELADGLIVRPSTLHGAQVHGFEDHRTIMALALAGLLAEGETVIDTAEGLKKTYPLFGEHLKTLNRTLYFD